MTSEIACEVIIICTLALTRLCRMPSTCIVCRQTGSSKNSVSMYRFPKDHVKRNEWLCALNLKEENVKEHL